jgi:serine/threonine protein kinase
MRPEASSDGVEVDATASMPQPGEVIGGKFVVERVLGVGGMGIVVAAHHSHLEQTVAIKFLRRDAAKDEAAVNRFLREARAVAALQSEHVVRVMDAGRLEDGLPYLVMEHLNGVDLDQVLVQRGRLPLEECLEYLLQCMEAVAEAHAAGIVHRDLKPSNLFLTTRPDGTRIVKVLDFGIAKALDPTGRQAVSLTATSMTLGSPLYMSPEQVRSSKSVDARTDIWALGIIAYEFLAGVQPFEAETVTGLCAKIVADEPEPLRSVRPDVPAAFEAVVMRCLEKNVANRYQSVGELAAALRPFASSDGLVSVSKIARISGHRPTLASKQDGHISAPSPSASATPTPRLASPDAVSDPAAGYAETVASWQTTGTRRGRRAMAATAGTVGGIALLAGVVLLAKWPGQRSQPSAAPTVAAGMAVDVPTPKPDLDAPLPAASARLPASTPTPTPLPTLAPTPTLAQPPLGMPHHPPVFKVPPAASPSAKPAPSRTQDDLLLDRK